METQVPDYIFMSGLSAQQARGKRMSMRPVSPRTPVKDTDEDREIKSVVGYLPSAHRAWPQQIKFDIPRLNTRNHIIDYQRAIKAIRQYKSVEEADAKANLLQTWFTFCRNRPTFSDGVCDENRLHVYADYLFEQTHSNQCNTAKVHFVAVQTRLAILWTVWKVPRDCTEKHRKELFNTSYRSIRDHVRKQIDKKYANMNQSSTSSTSPARKRLVRRKSTNSTPRKGKAATSNRPDDDASSEIAHSAFPLPPDPPRLEGIDGPATLDPGEQLAVRSKFGKHKANIKGDVLPLELTQNDHRWRVFSEESDVLLNCIFMRRASLCSLEMRLWHSISVSTWLDPSTIYNKITLGSLTLCKSEVKSLISYESISISVNKGPRCASPSDDSDQRDTSVRARRSMSLEGGTSGKVEMVRHKNPLQCPWNALAMLLFYKWHVLKEPLPYFGDESWMDVPLFGQGDAAKSGSRDDHIKRHCPDQYEEFRKAVSGNSTSLKRMKAAAYKTMKNMARTIDLFRSTVANARSLIVNPQLLRCGVFEAVQHANSGIDKTVSTRPGSIMRFDYAIPMRLQDMVFPFIDDSETIKNYMGKQTERDWRNRLTGFFKLLTTLRTVLIQDMMVMFDATFFRTMLRNNAIMSNDVFRSSLFANCPRTNNSSKTQLWNIEDSMMISLIPRDTTISKIMPDTSYPPNSTTALPTMTKSLSQPATASSNGMYNHKRRLSENAVGSTSLLPAESPERGAKMHKHCHHASDTDSIDFDFLNIAPRPLPGLITDNDVIELSDTECSEEEVSPTRAISAMFDNVHLVESDSDHDVMRGTGAGGMATPSHNQSNTSVLLSVPEERSAGRNSGGLLSSRARGKGEPDISSSIEAEVFSDGELWRIPSPRDSEDGEQDTGNRMTSPGGQQPVLATQGISGGIATADLAHKAMDMDDSSEEGSKTPVEASGGGPCNIIPDHIKEPLLNSDAIGSAWVNSIYQGVTNYVTSDQHMLQDAPANQMADISAHTPVDLTNQAGITNTTVKAIEMLQQLQNIGVLNVTPVLQSFQEIQEEVAKLKEQQQRLEGYIAGMESSGELQNKSQGKNESWKMLAVEMGQAKQHLQAIENASSSGTLGMVETKKSLDEMVGDIRNYFGLMPTEQEAADFASLISFPSSPPGPGATANMIRDAMPSGKIV
ncbi:hypothetical protein GGI07_001629 [Coemansia sp. Benny D115]|nr:hypothetical protein GGI07_001629 [Coemansia sp. Benny D115]